MKIEFNNCFFGVSDSAIASVLAGVGRVAAGANELDRRPAPSSEGAYASRPGASPLPLVVPARHAGRYDAGSYGLPERVQRPHGGPYNDSDFISTSPIPIQQPHAPYEANSHRSSVPVQPPSARRDSHDVDLSNSTFHSSPELQWPSLTIPKPSSVAPLDTRLPTGSVSGASQTQLPTADGNTRPTSEEIATLIEHNTRLKQRFADQRDRAHAYANVALIELQSLREDEELNNTWYQNQAGIMLAYLLRAQAADPAAENIKVGNVATVHHILEHLPNFRTPVVFDDPEIRHLATGYSISKVLEEYGGSDDDLISAQDPGSALQSNGMTKVKISDLKQRFLTRSLDGEKRPYNILSFAAKDPLRLIHDRLLPSGTKDLLDDIWEEVEKSKSQKAREMANGPKPQSWVTFAQAGSLTTPHIDVNGQDTYIVVGQGQFLFLYCSTMTDDDIFTWSSDQRKPPNGHKWCYVLLEAGQGVLFPAGTPHAVVRRQQDMATLSFGGHFVRSDQLARTVDLCARQLKEPAAVNEDPQNTVWVYLILLAKRLISMAKMAFKDEWKVTYGGPDAIRAFFNTLRDMAPGKLETDYQVLRATPFNFKPNELKRHIPVMRRRRNKRVKRS